jgi:hypothetical protein
MKLRDIGKQWVSKGVDGLTSQHIALLRKKNGLQPILNALQQTIDL